MSPFTVVKLLASIALMGFLFEHAYAASFIPGGVFSKELKRTVRQDGFLTKQDQKADMAGESTDHHIETQGEFKIGLNLFDGLTFKGDGSVDYGKKSAEAATGKFKDRQSGGFLFPSLPIIGFTENRDRVPRDVSDFKKGLDGKVTRYILETDPLCIGEHCF